MNQPTLYLERISDDGKRTRGLLLGAFPGGKTLRLYTLEEPWKNNAKGQSCIPAGSYPCVPHGWEPNTKLKQKKAYRLTGTHPREAILIHTGNTVNDIEGCILVGMQEGLLGGMDAVVRSRDAMEKLRDIIGNKPFTLIIKEIHHA